MLRVNEAHDLGDKTRFEFYDHMKTILAAPPNTHRIDEKNTPEYYALNCNGTIITTNYKDGLYLPADDRRVYVAWSSLSPSDFPKGYWEEVWRWYDDESGFRHVAAYLSGYDISSFNAKAPPPKTPAFWQMVQQSVAPEEGALADVLDKMGNPEAVTIEMIVRKMSDDKKYYDDFYDWITDRKNSRSIPHRMERCGYVSVRNNADKNFGLWAISGGGRSSTQRRTSP
jgi:hypothetical protein